MSREEELEAEIIRLQTDLVNATTEIEQLSLDKQNMVRNLEEEKRVAVAQAEYDAHVKTQAEKEAADAAVKAAKKEVAELKAAFEGDTSGWAEGKDEQGRPMYQNSYTGEVCVDKPVVLRIAETMAAVASSQQAVEQVAKFRKQAEEAKTQARGLQTKINEYKEQINVLTQLNREWTKSGVSVHGAMMLFQANLNEKLGLLHKCTQALTNKCVLVESQHMRVAQAVPAYAKLKTVTIAQREEIGRLTERMKTVGTQYEDLLTKHKFLSEHFEEELDRNTRPVQDEMTRLYAQLQESFLQREEDRKDLATLWPPEHLMPSALAKYKPVSEEQRQERKRRVDRADAEIALRAEIQQRCYEATRWTQQYDSYGRTYYLHTDTGESSWEEPEGVAYRPPVGRDRDGNKVDPNDAPRVYSTSADAWGNPVYTNLLTGEVTSDKPPVLAAYEEMQRVQEEEKAKAHMVDPETEAMNASRVVIRFLKRKLAEQERRAALNMQLYDGAQELGVSKLEDPAKAEEEDASKWVYDMHMVEELARGPDQWSYEEEDRAAKEAIAREAERQITPAMMMLAKQQAQDKPKEETKKEEEVPLTPEEVEEKDTQARRDVFADLNLYTLRELLHKAARREGQLQDMLRQVRRHMSDMSVVLVKRVAEKKEEERVQQALEAAAAATRLESEEGGGTSEADVDGSYADAGGYAEEGPGTQQDQGAALQAGLSGSHKGSLPSSARSQRSSNAERPASSRSKGEGGGQTARSNASSSANVGKGSMENRENQTQGSGGSVGQQHSGRASVATDTSSAIDGRSPHSTPSRKSSEAAAQTQMGNRTLHASLSQAPFPAASALTPPSFVPYGRAANPLVHALVTEAFYAGYFDKDVQPVDLPSIRSHYSACPDKGAHEAVELGEEWLLAHFFHTSDKPDRFARRPRAPTRRRAKKGEAGSNAPLVLEDMELLNMDNRFLCMPLPYHHEPQLEEPPIPPPQPDPIEVERQKKRRKAERLREARKKGIKVEDLPEDPPEPVLPSTYTGQPLPLVPLVDSYLTLGNKPPLAIALGIHERLRLETDRVLERQMVLFDSLASDASLIQVEEEEEVTATAAIDSIEEGEGWEGEEGWEDGVAGDDKLHEGQNDGPTRWSEHASREEEYVSSGRTFADRPNVTWRMGKVAQMETDYMSGDALAALRVREEEERQRREGMEELLLESLEEADPVMGGKAREMKEMEAREQAWKERAAQAVQKGEASKPQLSVHGIGGLRVRCPELELRHEQERQEATLGPLLDEADALRAKAREQHTQMMEQLTVWAEETQAQKAATSADFKKLNFEASDKFNLLKTLSIPRAEPKRPSLSSAAAEATNAVTIDSQLADRYRSTGQGPEYQDEEVENLAQYIAQGSYDGQMFEPPEAKALTVDQVAWLVEAVNARNRALGINVDAGAASAYRAEQEAYEGKVAEWRRMEQSRLQRLREVQCQARVLYLRLDGLTAIREQLEARAQDVQAEQEVEQRRFEYLCENENRINVLRGKYVADRLRSEDAIKMLQDQVCKVLKLYELARRLHECALSDFERPGFVEEGRHIMTALCYPMLKLREALVEEGRRLRVLMEEEVAVAKVELMRLREDRATDKEQLRYLHQLSNDFKNYIKGVHYATDVRAALAAQRLEVPGLNTEYKERYPSDWAWDEEDEPMVTFASYQHDLTLKVLKERMACRADRRAREEEARVMHATVTDLQLPPVSLQWLHKATEQRYKSLLEVLRCGLNVEAIEAIDQLVQEKRKKMGVERRVEALEKQMQVMAQAHEQEACALREVALSTFDILKEQTARLQAESRRAIDAINQDLKQVTEEYDNLRERYGQEVGEYRKRVVMLEEWVKTLRLALNTQTEELEKLTDDAESTADRLRNEALSVKAELRVEREHCYRLELWVFTLLADMRKYEGLLRDKDRAYEALVEKGRQDEKQHKYKAWCTRVALQKLAVDPRALFLFFIQRVATMAGARSAYNDALRHHRVLPVIIAYCQSEDEEVRRHAVRALGNVMWNGYVEQRVLVWDVNRLWSTFEEEAVAEEEARLKQVVAGLRPKLAVERQQGEEDEEYDPTKQGFEDEFRPSPSLPVREVIRVRRQWGLRLARRKESPNLENQRMVGASEKQLNLILKLCKDPVQEVVRNAALSLSLAAYCEDNVDRLGQLPGCVDTLLYLSQEGEACVQAQALVAIANLAYSHPKNQEAIAAAGALDMLLGLCRNQDSDSDVIESATAALANLTAMWEPNCVAIARAGGVEVLTGLLTSNQTSNLLDFDQVEEIQANAAEALANITKLSEHKDLADIIHAMGIQPFVIMCGSRNIQVMRHASLVIGNIAQNDSHREAFGEAGVIEALFVLVEREDDRIIQANALWALGNLAWNRNNADRIGRYLSDLLRMCKCEWVPVQTNAMVCLSNALYYNDENRQLLEDTPDGISLIVGLCDASVPDPVSEPAMRALVSLTYPDRLAIPLVVNQESFIPMLVKQVNSTSVEVQRQAIRCLTNLAVHDANKPRLVEASAVEALVMVQGSDDEALRLAGAQLLELLADVKSPEDLVDRRFDIGMDGLIHLSVVENEPVQRLAIETLVDMAQSKPERQQELMEKGGVDLFLRLIRSCMEQNLHSPLLEPSLWGLRNLAHNNRPVMTRLGRKGGMELLLDVVRRCKGITALSSTLEAALAALLVMLLGHEANCRKIMMVGLDLLCSVAENHTVAKEAVQQSGSKAPTTRRETTDFKEYNLYKDDLPAQAPIKGAHRAVEKNCVALATSILQLLGPYNVVVCDKCGAKEKGGNQCSKCGKMLNVDDGSLDLGEHSVGAHDGKGATPKLIR